MPSTELLRGDTAVVDGRPIHARVSIAPVDGDAPTMVLVHGLGVSSRYLVPLASHLAPTARVFAPDLPGFGKSLGPPRALGVPELAEALYHWLQSRTRGPVLLMGHSFGCQVVAELAARHPDWIEGLVLASPTVDPRAPSLRQQFLRLLLDETREPLLLGVPMLLDYRDAGLPRIIATGRAMIADRLEAKLGQIAAPALVVRGSRDPIASQDWVEEVSRLLRNGRLSVVPGASHAVNFSHPSELARLLADFAAELRAGSPIPVDGTTPPSVRARSAASSDDMARRIP